ncbi:MAG: hypothetical protein HZB51_30100 [Chloroflexi bacterium]|nr:hypothetical protein [Chloroflexota bacterium]
MRDLKLAEREKVLELTNCDFGFVSLFNEGFQPLMDRTILERQFVYGGTGSSEHDLKIKPCDLITLNKAQVEDITEG